MLELSLILFSSVCWCVFVYFIMVSDALPKVDTGSIPVFNPAAFFEAIPSDRERAVAMIAAQVPPDGPPTPKVEPYLRSGEWDDDNLVSIVFVGSDCCFGKVGDGSGVHLCFCGEF